MLSPDARVLVVVAHPDDEAIGCGATVAKLTERGHEVTVLLPLRRCDPRGVANWSDLIAAFHTSCGRLGAKPVLTEPLLDEVRAEAELAALHDAVLPHVEAADVVLTHFHGDTNQVHRGVSRAVEIATRGFRRRRDVYLFEVATSTDSGYAPAFAPTAWSMLDEQAWTAKAEAAAAYGDSELVRGRRVRDLRALAEVRGAQAGCDLAEAFVTARQYW